MHCLSYELASLIISAITGEYLICVTTKLDTRSPHQKSQWAGTTAYGDQFTVRKNFLEMGL